MRVPGRAILFCLFAILFSTTVALAVPRQASPQPRQQTRDTPLVETFDAHRPNAKNPPTPLAKLVEEAQKNNPQVIAARRAWQAAEQVPSQVSTLPDPEVVVQHVSAGTPIPGWNFNSIPMTFIGFGISQDFPYPGKLHLRGEMAGRQASAMGDRVESARRDVAAQVKIAYFQLSYIREALHILGRDEALISQVEKIAEAHYRVGQGNQQDVLKAEVEQTELLRDRTRYRQQSASLEARLKQLLNRPPDSPDITPEALVQTPLSFRFNQLLSSVRAGNPDLGAEQETVTSRGIGVQLARKDFYPDFHFQYMYQQTGSETPNRYALTLGVRIPIYHSRRQEPELAQAAAQLNQSRRQYEADVQRTYFDVQDQYLAADADAKVLKIYREGLIPQATATFQTGLAAYQVGGEDFQSLLDSFLDVLNLDTEYWRTLAGYESSLARLEELTGVALP